MLLGEFAKGQFGFQKVQPALQSFEANGKAIGDS
jgi:hypothetical protein